MRSSGGSRLVPCELEPLVPCKPWRVSRFCTCARRRGLDILQLHRCPHCWRWSWCEFFAMATYPEILDAAVTPTTVSITALLAIAIRRRRIGRRMVCTCTYPTYFQDGVSSLPLPSLWLGRQPRKFRLGLGQFCVGLSEVGGFLLESRIIVEAFGGSKSFLLWQS